MSEQHVREAEEILGHRFHDSGLLAQALTHSSSADAKLDSNERLEFLGDSILGVVVCEHIFIRFEELLEGELTKIKSTVVSRDTCAQVAQELGLDRLLRLGKGMRNRGDIPLSLAAGCFESVLGALYIDAGFDVTRAFLLECLDSRIKRAFHSGHQQNFKSVLQQVAQQMMAQTPSYIMLDEKGPDHAKCFEVCVELGARRFSSSWGASKKHAEQQAALNALCEMGHAWTDDEGEVHLVPPDAEGSEISV